MKFCTPFDVLTVLNTFRDNMNNACAYANIIGRTVTVTVDRPLFSVHPKHAVIYELNYGFVEGVLGGDNEWQDAYILGVDEPVATFDGVVIAVIVRLDDNETKWVVAPVGKSYTREQIAQAVRFQEKYFHSYILTRATDGDVN